MPHLSRSDLVSSLVFGAIALVAFALACSHAALYGGPSWLEGQELATFIKLSLATASIVAVDIFWKASTD